MDCSVAPAQSVLCPSIVTAVSAQGLATTRSLPIPETAEIRIQTMRADTVAGRLFIGPPSFPGPAKPHLGENDTPFDRRERNASFRPLKCNALAFILGLMMT